MTVPNDGYIMASRSIAINNVQVFNPSMVPRTIAVNDDTANVTQYEYIGANIVPVQQGNIVSIFRAYNVAAVDPPVPVCDYNCTEPDQYNTPNLLPRYIPCVQPRN